MEVWLKLNNSTNNGSFTSAENPKIDFRFPVIPPEFEIELSRNINSTDITKFGEVNGYGGINARQIPLSSFFPNHKYPFCSYSDFPEPYKCVEIIENMIRNNQIPRLIITDTNINMPVLIENFKYKKQKDDGSGDLYFELSFKEHIRVEIPKAEDPNSSKDNSQNNSRPSNNTNSTQQKIHKVVKGDNLWDISQKYLGKGSLYNKIKEANWNTYTSLKKNNIIYVNWKLVIPKV